MSNVITEFVGKNMSQHCYILLGLSIIDMIGMAVCLDGFKPVYTQKINRTEMRQETATHVYIATPSTEASCSVLCGLTPGCMWVRYTSDTRICTWFHAACLQPTENQGSYLTAVFSNVVNAFSKSKSLYSSYLESLHVMFPRPYWRNILWDEIINSCLAPILHNLQFNWVWLRSSVN